jgi:hypothetical protein
MLRAGLALNAFQGPLQLYLQNGELAHGEEYNPELGMLAHAYNFSIQEAEGGGL